MSSSLCPDNFFVEKIDDYNRYEIGVTSHVYNHAEENYRNMLHLIAYDIRTPKRLRCVAQACEDFGIRVEYSVFECDLSEDDFKSLWSRFMEVMNPDEDCILAYKICGSCVTKIESMGAVIRPGKTLLYIL